MRLSGSKNYVDDHAWHCSNKDCTGIENIRNNNILFNSFPRIKFRILLIFIFTHFTVLLSPVLSKTILGLSKVTIRELSKLLNSWIVEHQLQVERNVGKFGGERKIVELDESCFFKRKNNKGRIQKQIWGFGFVERESGRLFVRIVPNRSAETLLPIIQEWIAVNTKMLVSEEWRAYSKLKDKGYNHKTIKHKDNFVDKLQPTTHTQNIENRWGLIKSLLKRSGKILRVGFDQKVIEIVWRIMNKNDLQNSLLQILIKKINQ